MQRKLVTFMVGILVVSMASRCGPKVTEPVTPDEIDTTGSEIKYEEASLEPSPPEPPEVYVGTWEEKGEKPAALLAAEKKFEEKNYKKALVAYHGFIQKQPESYWVPHATFQSARCHYMLSEYDEALNLYGNFAKARPGLLWEARARVLVSALYHALPTYGYERDGKVYYNYEHHEGEYRYMYAENRDIAVEHLEWARLAYVALLAVPEAKRGSSEGDDVALEAVDVAFQLESDIDENNWEKQDACPPAAPLDPRSIDEPYDPAWGPREKILYLLDEVPRFNQGRDDTHPEAWALFRKALFLMTNPECPPAGWEKKVAAEREAWESKQRELYEEKAKKSAKDLPLEDVLELLKEPDFTPPRWNPGADLDPMSLVERILETYPKDRHAELYAATRGRILEGRGEYLAAMKVYEQFIKDHPDSPWKGDAEQSLWDMQHPSLSASTHEISLQGEEKPRLSLSTRNLGKVKVEIREVDLPSILLKYKHVKDHEDRFTDLWTTFKNYKAASKVMKKTVWTGTYETKDRGDHAWVSGYLELPELPIGTYFIHIKGGKQDVIQPWIRSDVVILGKSVKDEFRYVVTDSATGAPLPDFPITVREVYEKDIGLTWVYKVKVVKAVTDASGRYTYPLTKGNKISYNRVQALAHEGRRMAMTQEYSGPYRYSSDTGETYRIFTVTDRPVYRTGDTVKFKHIVRAYRDGRNEHVKGLKIHMEISDPKGDRLVEKVVDASAFGNAWGEVELPEDAALGVYEARAYVEGHDWRSYQSSGSTFRVEEYKKPEFEVKILPSKKLASSGDQVEARLTATYYFGAPVAGAEVEYKIFRSVFFHSYSPPDRWDWLYGSGFGVLYDQPYSYGEDLIDEGSGRTDDLGELLVKLPAIDEELEHDYEYKIVADVTDLSRRVISGAGSLKVTRDPYFAYVWPQHGFYTEGDNVEVELVALTADDEPVPAKGRIDVVRLEYRPGGEVKEKEIGGEDVQLDAAGRAFHRFKAKKAGQYRVTFTSSHEKSKQVKVERIVSVAGKTFASKWFSFDKVDVTSEKRTYLRGETVRMLVQSPWPDATLWVTYEGGDETFLDEVIQPGGMATVLEVKADDRLHPSFFVRVTAVHDGIVHTVSREMFIPPGEEILDVEVSPDRDEYKPRSKGTFSIKVRDHKGKPVRGEFSLAVFDSSVLYIQSESTGDIRSYYYGERRYNDIAEFHSGQIWLTQFTRDSTKWPTFDVMGLPAPSGYFPTAWLDRGWFYTCPSCEPLGKSQWRFDLPEGGGTVTSTPIPPSSWAVSTRGVGNMPSGASEVLASQSMLLAGAELAVDDQLEESGKMLPAKPAEKPAVVTKASPALGGAFEDEDGIPDVADADVVRGEFPDTALWVPDVVTGKDGKASVDIEWPDSLTTWAVRVFGIDGTSRVGIARAQALTTKKLVARIETPRFMVEGDRVTLAAVVHNSYPEDREVALELGLEGGVDPVGPVKATIDVPAGKDARHDFEVVAMEASELTVRLSAKAKDDADALERKLPIMEWGSDKMVSRMGSMRAPGSMTLELELPAERRKDTTELVLSVEPTVAGVVLKSIPYLIHYPYGCVEQTMSRFLPAAMVARTLKDMGIKLEEIPTLAEKASLADPVSQVHGDVQLAWWEQPVYDDKELDKVIRRGLKRLYSFQHADGGWAWWKEGKSDPHMTAYVVTGLWEADQAGYSVNKVVLDSGMRFLERRYKKDRKRIEKKTGWDKISASERHHMAYLAYALSLEQRIDFDDVKGLYEHREALTHYGKSLFALTMANLGENEKATLAVENLADLAWADEKNQTASFKFEAKEWWRWYNDRVETVAWALRAFTRIAPSHKYGAYFARWLVNNREGNRWYSTRDTALSILALNEYMREHAEFDPDYEIELRVDGKTRKTYTQTKENLLTGEGRVILRGDVFKGDKVRVEVVTKGEGGAVYASAFLSFFTKEKKIEGAGNEILVERSYHKLTEKKKKVKTWHGTVTKIDYVRTELRPGDPVKSGDLVEVKIMVTSKNDYEYLVFEDFKPAGFEPTELKSGGIFQHGAWWNRELRDEKVVNFLYALEQGEQAITYKLRAEIPGTFRVLPHKAYAMYAPRVRAISDSWQISVQ